MLRKVPRSEECVCTCESVAPVNAYTCVQTFSLLSQLIPIGLCFLRTHSSTHLQGEYEEQWMIETWKFESMKCYCMIIFY